MSIPTLKHTDYKIFTRSTYGESFWHALSLNSISISIIMAFVVKQQLFKHFQICFIYHLIDNILYSLLIL